MSVDKQIAAFRRDASADIERMLVDLVGPERARKSALRIGLALAGAVRAARRPEAIMNCSRGSIMQCVAAATAVDLYPRGTNSPVWLVPKKGELQFWLSHIGLATLAQRAGIALRPVVVHHDDEWEVVFGDVSRHRPYAEPEKWEDVAGVYVVVKRIADGAVIGTPWVSAATIARRKAQGGPVWGQWPIEMAMKTAIKYLVGRGIVVIDLPELSVAMDAEPRDVWDAGATSEAVEANEIEGSASELLGLEDKSEAEAIADMDIAEDEPERAPFEPEPEPVKAPPNKRATKRRRRSAP